MTCSNGTNRSPSGITTNRGSTGGTFTRAIRCSPVPGSPTSTRRFSDRLEMYGNGCPGSTASGVSTGKIWRWKTSTRYARSSSLSDDQSDSRTPASPRAGTSRSRKIRSCRAISSSTRARITFSCSPGRSPSTDRVRTPATTLSCRPATRTWKNSSMSWAKIAMNFTRSSRASLSSSARSRRRAAKSSRDSSRLVNRW